MKKAKLNKLIRKANWWVDNVDYHERINSGTYNRYINRLDYEIIVKGKKYKK